MENIEKYLRIRQSTISSNISFIKYNIMEYSLNDSKTKFALLSNQLSFKIKKNLW